MAAAVVEGWLPEELLTLILSKLPVESLLRLKCVQKSWYSLIKSPHFINLHLHRCSSSKKFIVTRCIERPLQTLSFHSYETLDDLGNDVINVPITYMCHIHDITLSGPCDGLVCMSNLYDQILICNPATRELRPLFLPPSFGKRPGFRVDSVAFGSDPNTPDQYKLLMIRSALYDSSRDKGRAFWAIHFDFMADREAQMYDFSTDSWRETAVVFPGPFSYKRRSISLNGAFHWCPRGWHNKGNIRTYDSNVLTFSISDETTGLLPLPDFVDLSGENELFVSSKSQIALVLCVGRRYEICVMTEYGVKESWTRIFKIGPLCPGIYEPLAFWGEQQLLLLADERKQLVSWDLQNQNTRRFPIYKDFQLSVYPYSESLVSAHGIRGN